MANEYTSPAGQSDQGAQDLKAKAQDALGHVQDRAGEKIESRLDEGKHRAADTLSDVAESLLSTSQSMRDRGNEGVSRYMEKAADKFDRLASYLDRADVHEMLDEVEDFGRRQPGAFIAGAFTVGFLASRFLKSSRGDMSSGTRRLGYTSNVGRDDFGSRPIHYGQTAPSAQDWRRTGYAASGTGSSSELMGDPSTRRSSGLDSNSDRDRGV